MQSVRFEIKSYISVYYDTKLIKNPIKYIHYN